MKIFPTIQSLAEAPIEKVIKIWEGLGYYSRARNLHQGAQYLTEHYGGELPETYDALKKVKTRVVRKTPVTDNFGCIDFFRKAEGKLI